MKTYSYMKSFCERYGIKQSWIARNTTISESMLSRQFCSSTVSQEVADQLIPLFKTTGEKLQRFRFSKNHKKDIADLRCIYGISSAWLAEQLGMKLSSFVVYLMRGLTEDKTTSLQLALQDVANAMIHFKIPKKALKDSLAA